MNKMYKIFTCFALMLFAACSATVEIETNKNYEAVVLPDGSQVLLNHNSTLWYHEEFSPRTIHLSGEAFFSVAPNSSTFTVVTAFADVEVLGTEFNVNTTSEQVVVDVKKGLVELKTAYNASKVKKGIRAIYKDGENAVQQIKSKKEYRKWTNSLKKEFKSLGKELKPVLKKIGDEVEKAGKSIGGEFKK